MKRLRMAIAVMLCLPLRLALALAMRCVWWVAGVTPDELSAVAHQPAPAEDTTVQPAPPPREPPRYWWSGHGVWRDFWGTKN